MKKLDIVAVAVFASLSVAAQAEDAGKVVDRKSPNFVKCVKLEETGSLVKKTRVCKTNAEWKKINENQTRDANDLIERNRSGTMPNG